MRRMDTHPPRIAITSGDPAGVGPELCLKFVAGEKSKTCQPIIFGDANVFRRVAEKLSLPLPKIETELDAALKSNVPVLFDFQNEKLRDIEPGTVSATTGVAAFAYIDRAISCAMEKRIDAIMTAPIHKEALHQAGVPFPGHTEMLVEKTSAAQHSMMLTSPEITCSLVTAHVGLDEVSELLTQERIVEVIELSHAAMAKIRDKPASEVQIIVCGLNPHAGESGLFGRGEEETIIEPAIQVARSRGINVVGPLPPDTAFTPSKRATTDCYVCMYHDQGLIPLKALSFDTAVNVTLGLPIVRTSVDHGTALDIAWQGIASISSFEHAMDLAIRLVGA